MQEDSIDGIYETLKLCAIISKSAGGIGLNISSIRSTGSYIAGTNGVSNGIVPMLRVFNNTARYVDQGGNKVIVDIHVKDVTVFLADSRAFLFFFIIATRCFCYLLGALACGRFRLPGIEKEHRQRREPSARLVLRPVDLRSVHAPGRGQ